MGHIMKKRSSSDPFRQKFLHVLLRFSQQSQFHLVSAFFLAPEKLVQKNFASGPSWGDPLVTVFFFWREGRGKSPSLLAQSGVHAVVTAQVPDNHKGATRAHSEGLRLHQGRHIHPSTSIPQVHTMSVQPFSVLPH